MVNEVLVPMEHHVLLSAIGSRIARPFFGYLGLDVEHILARGGAGWKLYDKCARSLYVWFYFQVYSRYRDRACGIQSIHEFERFKSLHIVILSAEDSSFVVLIHLFEP